MSVFLLVHFDSAIKGKRKVRYEGNIAKFTVVLTHASLVLKRVSNIKEFDVFA